MGGPPERVDNEYQVLTRWESEESFRGWIHSDAFKRAHSREFDSTIFDGRSCRTLHEPVGGVGASGDQTAVSAPD